MPTTAEGVFKPVSGQADHYETKQTLPSSRLGSYQRLNYTTAASQNRDRCMITAEDVSERVSGQAGQYKNGQNLPSSNPVSYQGLGYKTSTLFPVFTSYTTLQVYTSPLVQDYTRLVSLRHLLYYISSHPKQRFWSTAAHRSL